MERLRQWLAETRTTQAALANSIGVNQVSISQWVNGVHTPPVEKLRALSKKTGLSLDELLSNRPRKFRNQNRPAA